MNEKIEVTESDRGCAQAIDELPRPVKWESMAAIIARHRQKDREEIARLKLDVVQALSKATAKEMDLIGAHFDSGDLKQMQQALRLAEKAIASVQEFGAGMGQDACCFCHSRKFAGHDHDCNRKTSLAAIREALK